MSVIERIYRYLASVRCDPNDQRDLDCDVAIEIANHVLDVGKPLTTIEAQLMALQFLKAVGVKRAPGTVRIAPSSIRDPLDCQMGLEIPGVLRWRRTGR